MSYTFFSKDNIPVYHGRYHQELDTAHQIGSNFFRKAPVKDIDKVLKTYPEITTEAYFLGITSRSSICMFVLDKKVTSGLRDDFTNLLLKYDLVKDMKLKRPTSVKIVHSFSRPFKYNILGVGMPKVVVDISFFKKGLASPVTFEFSLYVNSFRNLKIVLLKNDKLRRLFYKEVNSILYKIYSPRKKQEQGIIV